MNLLRTRAKSAAVPGAPHRRPLQTTAPAGGHGRLLILVVLFVCLGATYAWATPLFESPDESSHLQVIDYLAKHHRLYPPTVLEAPVTSGTEVAWVLGYHSPPLYYTPPLYHVLGALLTGWIDMRDLPDRLVPSPSWGIGWAPQRNAEPWNKNVYAHLPGEDLRVSPTVRAAALLRGVSLALGVVTVICTYWLSLELWPRRCLLALGAAACVALNPQFIAISVGVTNDPMIIALFSLVLLCAVRAVGRKTETRVWVRLGVLVGMGLLTKQTAFLLLPVGLLAILAEARLREQGGVRRALTHSVAFGLPALLVGGGWYLWNMSQSGGVLGTATHFSAVAPLECVGLRELAAIFETYWAGFGWALISAPRWVYGFYFVFTCLGVGGLVRALAARERFHREPSRVRWGLGLLGAAWVLNAATLVGWAIETGAPYGRLLFPTITPVAILLAYGIDQWRTLWLSSRPVLGQDIVRSGAGAADTDGRSLAQMLPESTSRVFAAVLGGVAVLALVLAAGMPWTVLRPAFAAVRWRSEMPQSAQAVDVSFERGITLLGVEADDGNLRQGETLDMRLFWLADQAPAQRLNVWLQLGPQDATQRIAGVDTWLGGTSFPSDLWQSGDLVEERYALEIPATAPAPGLYWVRLGLVDEQGQRLNLPDGNDVVTLGPWRLRRRTVVARPDYRLDAALENGVILRGYELAYEDGSDAGSQGDLTVSLVWEARKIPAQDYSVFVHLLDAEGTLLAQHDGVPANGDYPTAWWLTGDVIPDIHVLDLEEALPSASAYLLVGMYDPATVQRVGIVDAGRGSGAEGAIRIDLAPGMTAVR